MTAVYDDIYINRGTILKEKVSSTDKIIQHDLTPSEELSISLLKKKHNILKIYNKIYSVVKMPSPLQPELEFISKGMNIAAFANTTAKIYIDESILKIIDERDAVFILRHELEHVRQFHNMMRMLGMQEYSKLITGKNSSSDNLGIEGLEVVNIEYYKKVEQLLGKIDKDSQEGFLTQKYIDAFNNYPDLIEIKTRKDIGIIKKNYLLIKEYIFNYRFNLLEREANKAARRFIKTFKM